MQLFGLCGLSNSGKTTLMAGVIAELTRRGYKVGAIKHHGHRGPVVEPAVLAGKDSAVLARAGAVRVALAHAGGVSLAAEPELEKAGPAALAETFMAGLDLVLVEGYKNRDHPKLEVVAAGASPRLAAENVTAYATPGGRGQLNGRPLLDANQPREVARFIIDHCRPRPGEDKKP